MINCVGFVVNPHKPEAFPLAEKLIRQAREASKDVVVEEPAPDNVNATQLPLTELVQRADVIFVLGGDGSMLRVAREAAPAGKPMMGVHFGHYGFIMETEPEDAPAALARVLTEDFTISNRLMLQIELKRNDTCVGEYLALNDIVVGRGMLSRMLRLGVVVGAHEVVRYSADGIIIATPTGSTAYSLSAGGPVVHPDLDVVIITPIAPHTLNSRALVIPAGDPIQVYPAEEPGNAVLTVDGQILEHIEEDDVIYIQRASLPARLVQPTESAFYQQLDSRLGFGHRLDR